MNIGSSAMALLGCEWCGRIELLLKYIKKWPPPYKMLLYFFIVVPGRRWHIKKKIKKFELLVLHVMLLSLVLVTFFFTKHHDL